MGKKRKLLHKAAPNRPSACAVSRPLSSKRPNGHTTPSKKPSPGSSSSSSRLTQARHLEPVIPFAPSDAILLIGEGDLSFAASLVEHHCCEKVTATVLEKDAAELLAKYPHARANIDRVEAEDGCRVVYGVDARKMKAFTTGRNRAGGSDPVAAAAPAQAQAQAQAQAAGAMDRIFFNFPHVGGKSTDVNRQVRANQELLVDFFGRALRSLAPCGTVLVTLFEAEPYTLWNVRDLARHCGLAVERSFRFRSAAYPGYHHARTLGVVRSRATGEPGAGWKGEERAARTYVFVRKDEVPKPVAGVKKRRRPGDESSSSDDEDG